MMLEKERGSISNLLWLLTFLVSSWTIVWSIIDMEIWIFRYFTIQSNFLVMLVAIFYYTMKEDKPFFKPLSTIALFNIIVTGVVFHTMLSQFSGSFLVELQHTFVPIIYVIFYFVVLKEGIDIKKFWILLIYPFVYFVIFFHSRYFYELVSLSFYGSKHSKWRKACHYHFYDGFDNGSISFYSYLRKACN